MFTILRYQFILFVILLGTNQRLHKEEKAVSGTAQLPLYMRHQELLAVH